MGFNKTRMQLHVYEWRLAMFVHEAMVGRRQEVDGSGGSAGSLHEIQVPLSEMDIPGASLSGRNPANLTIPQLKRWLQCRDAPTKGKKADLVVR